jgi:hypothetical protein
MYVWAGGMTQAVQHQPSMREVLSSNPSTTKEMDWRSDSGNRVHLVCKCRALNSNPGPTKKTKNKQKKPSTIKEGKKKLCLVNTNVCFVYMNIYVSE